MPKLLKESQQNINRVFIAQPYFLRNVFYHQTTGFIYFLACLCNVIQRAREALRADHHRPQIRRIIHILINSDVELRLGGQRGSIHQSYLQPERRHMLNSAASFSHSLIVSDRRSHGFRGTNASRAPTADPVSQHTHTHTYTRAHTPSFLTEAKI